jgi:hypothetical protein
MQTILDLYLYSAAWLPVIILVLAARPGSDPPPGTSVGVIVLACGFGFATWVGLLTINTFFS